MEITNITDEEYRAMPGENFSLLKHLLKSPAHYQAARTSESEPTINMELGSMIHAWFLEGKAPEYVLRPTENAEGEPWHGAKKWCKEWRKAHEGQLVLEPGESEREIRMCKALAQSEAANRLLALSPKREVVMTFTYRGVPIKCKLDAVGSDAQSRLMVNDLKKTTDGSPFAWGKRAYDMHYDMQAEIYKMAAAASLGYEDDPIFTWITVEDTEACPVTLYGFPGEASESGRRKLDRCIDIFLDCSTSGIWPAYGTGIMDCEWPKWAK
jgi:hypothetical protein